MTAEIDIAICTFRRPHIAATLTSVAGLTLPPATRIRVIVADNDDTPSARALVEETVAATGLDVTYLHAPARNISIARNACLDTATAPRLAFLDDDELATPGWLAALLAEPDAEVVLGPVQALYRADCPPWLRAGDFHSTYPVVKNSEIHTGYTCNVLFQRTASVFAGLHFREDLGRSGGEDTVFFDTAHRRGARIAYAATAIVTEEVPRERATLAWLLRRRFRSGQSHAVTTGLTFASQLRLILTAGAKMAFCYLVAGLSVMQRTRAVRWLLRGTVHLGVVSRLLGRREGRHYG